MLKTLAIKELRESRGLVILLGLTLGYVLFSLTGNPLSGAYRGGALFPFVSGTELFPQSVCLGAFAILLGFRQTAWELHNGTFYFLLHRPLPRRFVVAVKLTVGILLLLAINALFVGLYGWWADTPGHHPTPFFWSMTLPAWKTGWAMIPVYLGAFLSGIRPGNWFGSRLLPAVMGCAAGLGTFLMPWWWLTAIVFVLSIAVLLVSIFYHSETRDY